MHLPLRPTMRIAAALLAIIVWHSATAQPAIVPASGDFSLRFFGSGPADIDRVKIPLGPISNGQITSSRPVNVSGDFTIEFWMKAEAADNPAPACADAGWYYGNIIVDRDVDGAGDYGDYGVAICAGRIVFGVNAAGDDRLLVGSTVVTTGAWRHIAVTRAYGGWLQIFVDGALDARGSGPAERIDYRTNRATAQPNSDPYLVLGAEKHDYPGSRYYSGLLDDLRISTGVRYSAAFSRPSGPHPADASTVALYRFNEGAGTSVGDSSGAAGGPSAGVLAPRPGGPAQHWSSDTPFAAAPPPPGPSPGPGPSPSPGGCAPARTAPTALAPPPAVVTPAQFRFRVYLPVVACPPA